MYYITSMFVSGCAKEPWLAAPRASRASASHRGRRELTDTEEILQCTRIRDFKDTVYPFFESDTLLLECVVVLFFDV